MATPLRRTPAWLGTVAAPLAFALGLVGEGIGIYTFLGPGSVAQAQGLTTVEVIVGGGGFLAVWLAVAVTTRLRFGSWEGLRPVFGAAPRPLRALVLAAFALWLLTFAGLVALGGIQNKGIAAAGGHYYLLHPYGVRVGISHAEYQRQAAYPLWMVSSFVLLVSAMLSALAVPRLRRR